MNNPLFELLDRLEATRSLTTEEYAVLIAGRSPELAAAAAKKADRVRRAIYGNTVFIRGLIEIGNVCKNDCLYCGIRRSNKNCSRYRLSTDEILACCREGYPLGFRTFVMQGGEGGTIAVDEVCRTVEAIKREFPDCAVTLSLGEYPTEAYRAMRNAGADRYLLRHETADKAHYEMLHPKEMSWENRMRCLTDLKALGFQVGCGFMVGSPYQTTELLAKDLKFVETFRPDMCGIGPFIPHKDTPFADRPAGTVDETIFLLSLLRLVKPDLLLPATTALGSISPNGREQGILAGANVVMPNLSPQKAKENYTLYNNKLTTGAEAAQNLADLKARMAAIGYEIVSARGDIQRINE
ncbi:MAG: [FeFe] hydrogenase H-cluster radical SAM maturase HydE [Ruminococcaceae bacterium]|nr:[FeFe] hydrogenase H-cluster radical SAM maturase HydE [Oscillospiraceae bacterium]